MDQSDMSVISIQGPAEGITEGSSEKQSYKTALKHVLQYCTWDKMFLTACVLAVGTDALFFYVPIIHEDNKCLGSDKKLKIAAVVLRCFTDMFYITDIYYQIQNKNKSTTTNSTAQATCSIMEDSTREDTITGPSQYLYILTDILGVLPLPQVVIPVLFFKVRGTRSLDIKKFLNFLLLGQYVLRILRTYLSVKELKRKPNDAPGPVAKGALNLFLYVTASHVLGAFWYFFSVQRQTACWHNACRHHSSGCAFATFECTDSNTLANQTFLNDFCPINPPNATVFDFGIFLDALQLGVLGPMDFTKKFLQCYWWGLRNLSSFGQNLKTSTYAWETWFAILISVIGLLLFVYLIGNLQTYIQLATTKAEEQREHVQKKRQFTLKKKMKMKKTRQTMKTKEQEGDDMDVLEPFELQTGDIKNVERELRCRKVPVTQNVSLWMKENNIPEDMKSILRQHVRCRLEENKDINLKNMLSILPFEYKESLKKHFCFASLKKVPILQNKEVEVLENFIRYLEPVVYNESSYIIRKGEPLDLMFFITQGIVWSFPDNDDNGSNYGFTSFRHLEKGDYYGEELLKWASTLPLSISFFTFPISSSNVRSHTKVEALVLKASTLMAAVSKKD